MPILMPDHGKIIGQVKSRVHTAYNAYDYDDSFYRQYWHWHFMLSKGSDGICGGT